jgi:3-methyladenine DNA glycosylase AlkD
VTRDDEPVAFFGERFRAVGSPVRAVSERAYMKSALGFHGVDMRTIRACCADYCRARELDGAQLHAAVDALYATDWFDLRSAAVGLLERRRALIGRDDADWLIALVRRSACWAHVDWLATKIMPQALPARPATLLRSWASDDDFWVRRTALLAQLEALRAGEGDFALFAKLAEPMLAEREFFIRKAIGWVLRDVSRKRPELTFAFVRAHGERMSGLSYREATRRLPAALQRQLPRRA